MKERWKVCDKDGRDRECSFAHEKCRSFDWRGWRADSGYAGYGLSYEMCEYICEILNKYGDPDRELKLRWHTDDDSLGFKRDDE